MLLQSVEGCLEPAIGEHGLGTDSLGIWLKRLEPALDALRRDYETGALPLLTLPERRDDLEAARAALDRLCDGADTLVFFGTGGSSLGGQTLAQLGGWYIPGDSPPGKARLPRTRFYDNLDPRSLAVALERLDLATTRFVAISKSGNTDETLVQTLAALDAAKRQGFEARMPDLFLGLTEPAADGVANGLRAVCEAHAIPVLDHDPGIGGRFSALSNVGLLAGLARGLDMAALRAGGAEIVRGLLEASEAAQYAPALGAATAVGLSKERGMRVSVMLAYGDRLARFTHWYVQLWAESLGKGGEGTTPVAALGPVDQHSQLQLWLDGPREYMATVLRLQEPQAGPRIPADLAALAGAERLADRTAGDIVRAQQKAIPEALIQAGRPVRTIDLAQLDEQTMGGLMMHFMIETILAAHLLGVDPFDQPAVEAGKILTRKYLR